MIRKLAEEDPDESTDKEKKGMVQWLYVPESQFFLSLYSVSAP
jgi:hypothetical protein